MYKLIESTSLLDKVKELLSLENRHKLVLVQVHELERLKTDAWRSKHAGYVNQLYNHYIVNNGKKTYLS